MSFYNNGAFHSLPLKKIFRKCRRRMKLNADNGWPSSNQGYCAKRTATNLLAPTARFHRAICRIASNA
ncbi:unnamed protein product, partial [Nesidiocoris tenuis]